MPTENLTDARLRTLEPGDELIDAKQAGLIARCDGASRVAFSVRYRFGGVRRRFTIGIYPAVSLHEARKAAGRVREQVRNGVDGGGKVGHGAPA